MENAVNVVNFIFCFDKTHFQWFFDPFRIDKFNNTFFYWRWVAGEDIFWEFNFFVHIFTNKRRSG